jgi:hypothetical protein
MRVTTRFLRVTPLLTAVLHESRYHTRRIPFLWPKAILTYRQALKKEADTRGIDLRLLLDERRSGAFHCVGCGKPMVMRELFSNGDRVYQCWNGDCVKRIIRYQYQAQTGRVIEVT